MADTNTRALAVAISHLENVSQARLDGYADSQLRQALVILDRLVSAPDAARLVFFGEATEKQRRAYERAQASVRRSEGRSTVPTVATPHEFNSRQAPVAPDAARQAESRLIALALAYGGDTQSYVADAIPQAVWDALHEAGLVKTVRDFADEGQTVTTDAGVEALVAAAGGDTPEEPDVRADGHYRSDWPR